MTAELALLAILHVPRPDCATTLRDLAARMQQPGMWNHVAATSTLIVGDDAYAESCGDGKAWCVTHGEATASGAQIVGTSHVGMPRSGKRRKLWFRLAIDGAEAELRWRFGGKSWSGRIDACGDGYWTASAASSAIAIHFEGPWTAPR